MPPSPPSPPPPPPPHLDILWAELLKVNLKYIPYLLKKAPPSIKRRPRLSDAFWTKKFISAAVPMRRLSRNSVLLINHYEKSLKPHWKCLSSRNGCCRREEWDLSWAKTTLKSAGRGEWWQWKDALVNNCIFSYRLKICRPRLSAALEAPKF